ncbi:MAG: tetratricopeptide repeat protein [Bacteroidales bacterium]|nr:tetratricopeptide repeat protein [Bacteroidales bacterium]
MKRFLLLVFFLTSSIFFRGQIHLDSLHRKSIALRKYDPEKSFSIARQAYQLSLQQNSASDIALSLRNMGTACLLLGKYNDGIKYLQESQQWYEKINDLKGISACANNLGLIYKRTDHLDLAAYYFLKAIYLDLQLNDTAALSSGLNNLAEILQLKGRVEQALYLYQLSTTIDLKYGDTLSAALSLLNIANLYSIIDSTRKSMELLQKVIQIAKEYDHPLMMAHAFNLQGNNYRILCQYDSARFYLSHSLQLRKKYDDWEGLINSYIYYAYLLSDEGKFDSAQEYFFSAMNHCIETGHRFLAFHSLLTYGKMLHHQRKWHESTQTLLNAIEIAENSGYMLDLPEIYNLIALNYDSLGNDEMARKYHQLNILSLSKKPITPRQTITSSRQNFWLGILVFFFVVILFLLVWLMLEILKISKLRANLQTSHKEGNQDSLESRT